MVDATGRATVQRQTGEATRRRGDEVVPVSVGLDLEVGDTLRSTGARVRVRYRDGGQLTLLPETEVKLQERGVLQQLGEVLYQVEGLFRVQLGPVEAAVEGTRFVVSGQPSGPVTVAVDRGKVRVASLDQQVLVRRGQWVMVPDGGGPTEPTAQTPAQTEALSRLASTLGEPRLTVGLLAGSTHTAGDANTTAQLAVRARIVPGWRLSASVGLASTGERFHLPTSLGVERRIGPAGLGVEALAYFGHRTTCLGEVTLPLLPGIAATGRLRLPITDRLALETRLRGGGAGGPTFDATLGVSLGLGL